MMPDGEAADGDQKWLQHARGTLHQTFFEAVNGTVLNNNRRVIARRMALAKLAATEAGKAVMDIYEHGRKKPLKKNGSPSTLADKISAQIILATLKKSHLPVLSEEADAPPYSERQKWNYYWLVDPLDGTRDFINGSDEFTINIALMQKNKPVASVIYAPVANILYYGSAFGVYKKQNKKTHRLQALQKRHSIASLYKKDRPLVVASRSHFTKATQEFIDQLHHPIVTRMSSALKFMMLAEGRADVYPRFEHTMEWDTAAAQVLLNSLNRGIYELPEMETEITYNKPNLKNAWLIAF